MCPTLYSTTLLFSRLFCWCSVNSIFFTQSKITSSNKTSQNNHISAYFTFSLFSSFFFLFSFSSFSLFQLFDTGKAKVTDYLGWISQKNFGSGIYWLVKYCPMGSVRAFTLNHSYSSPGNKAAPASRRQVHNIFSLPCSQPGQKHHQTLPCFSILVNSVPSCFGITELNT